MEEKSDSLASTAESFQIGATRLEKIHRNRRMRALMIIAAMIMSFLLVLYIIFRSPTPATPATGFTEGAMNEASSNLAMEGSTTEAMSAANTHAAATGATTSTTASTAATTVPAGTTPHP